MHDIYIFTVNYFFGRILAKGRDAKMDSEIEIELPPGADMHVKSMVWNL
jgi:hypothetical protein